jgi:hypothetical protein
MRCGGVTRSNSCACSSSGAKVAHRIQAKPGYRYLSGPIGPFAGSERAQKACIRPPAVTKRQNEHFQVEPASVAGLARNAGNGRHGGIGHTVRGAPSDRASPPAQTAPQTAAISIRVPKGRRSACRQDAPNAGPWRRIRAGTRRRAACGSIPGRDRCARAPRGRRAGGPSKRRAHVLRRVSSTCSRPGDPSWDGILRRRSTEQKPCLSGMRRRRGRACRGLGLSDGFDFRAPAFC